MHILQKNDEHTSKKNHVKKIDIEDFFLYQKQTPANAKSHTTVYKQKKPTLI